MSAASSLLLVARIEFCIIIVEFPPTVIAWPSSTIIIESLISAGVVEL